MSDPTLLPKRFMNVTPSNTVSLPSNIGLYIGVGGDVIASGEDGVQATFTCQAGQYLVGEFQYLHVGTTASGIVAQRA